MIMGQHVSFHAENHEYDRSDVPSGSRELTRKEIEGVEDDCWVGSNVTFLDGVHVGRGCVIAAGTVVRGEIPAYSVVAGVPGRVIKSRRTSRLLLSPSRRRWCRADNGYSICLKRLRCGPRESAIDS